MKARFTEKALPAHRVLVAITAVSLVMALGGCVMVGPEYVPPEADVNPSWLESSPALPEEPPEIRAWWTAFDDPVLTRLVSVVHGLSHCYLLSA